MSRPAGPGGHGRLRLPGAGEVCLAWASSSAVDEGDAWLTPAEVAILARFRVSKRAADWRLGRWVAKEAVARALEGAVAPDDIEILAGPGGGPRARVLATGAWPPVSVTLSHSAGVGFAVAAVAPGGATLRIGCDVEEVAPRSEEFVSDYFTAEEAAWIRAGGDAAGPTGGTRGGTPGDPLGDPHVRANLLWSAKESGLKAMGEGLRRDTRSVVVDADHAEPPATDGWRPLRVALPGGDALAGWWRVADGLVWTVVG
ncbi:MAG: 4'-phosphopantetheinyl transferase superfamily protein [Gemmatimonadetes bacterium]|nr:4'-phosphopantetheinyl transferase superfamily protein [Gemmatimonadota bacterium]